MDKKEIKEIIGSNLPSGLGFSFSDDTLEIVLNSKSVFGNMQDDSSAFEGWILCIKSELENKGYQVKKVNIKFCDSFQMGDSPKEKQFCYRLFKCSRNYGWKIPEDAMIMANVEVAQNAEARLERIYIEAQKKKGTVINQQLPIGLFKDKVADVNRLTLTSFLDMWEIEEGTMRIYELKAKGNNKIGIISELLYYTNMMSDILNGRFSFEPNSKDYRGVETLKKSIGKIKHLEGVFLTDTLHPLIFENKKKLADTMAFISGAVNVSFTFEKNTDDISDYSDYMGR